MQLADSKRASSSHLEERALVPILLHEAPLLLVLGLLDLRDDAQQ